MITADELAGMLETAHLLRSPNNTKRLLATLETCFIRVKIQNFNHTCLFRMSNLGFRTLMGRYGLLGKKISLRYDASVLKPARIWFSHLPSYSPLH